MAYTFTFTPRFQKHFKTLTAQEIKVRLIQLAENPFHPSLRVKRIQGTRDLWECSVNMDIRILWYYEGDQIIVLLDIGHHDILTRY